MIREGTVDAYAQFLRQKIKLGRRAAGSELNAGYFADQVHYLQAAEREASMPSLFDTLEADEVL